MSRYIVLEGLDGVGKTTVMSELQKHIPNAVLTKEPGGPQALELGLTGYNGFRELCVDRPEIPQTVKRALYLADRIYNHETIVTENQLVISDRCWVSDLVYGSVFSKHTMEELYNFNFALLPQLPMELIYLYGPDRTLMTDAADILAKQKRPELEQAYEECFKQYNLKPVRINTHNSVSEVVKQVVNIIGS